MTDLIILKGYCFPVSGGVAAYQGTDELRGSWLMRRKSGIWVAPQLGWEDHLTENLSDIAT